nr:pyruvate decarboxylase 2 [Tanacetum cinerariifolium]
MSLEAAVKAAEEFLNKAVKPVIVGGPKLRTAHACQAFLELADASGYAFAVTPTAKGLVPECHPYFMGTYWGVVSTTFCAKIVESPDAYVVVGPMFYDGSFVGYSLLLKKEKMITVQPGRVMIGNGPTFGCILMTNFLQALAKRLKKNTTAYENHHRIYVPEGRPLKCPPNEPLRVMFSLNTFKSYCQVTQQSLRKQGTRGSIARNLNCHKDVATIGWYVGATLGYSQAAVDKRVIACIGDGSFQNPIIFLINNGGYTIKVEIHDGPYNEIKNWNYTGLVEAIHNGEGKCWTKKVFCEEDLIEAIETAKGAKKDCLRFIEVMAHKDDTSKELLEWGSRMSAANSRPPNPT